MIFTCLSAETSTDTSTVKLDDQPLILAEWKFLALAIALSFVSFLTLWYQAYGLNQSIQLAYVNHWLDPALYPRDPFPATGTYYASLLWQAIASLTAIIPLKWILLGGVFGERILSIYSAGRIARCLAGPGTLARVIAMSIMTVGPLPLLGAGTTMPDYFEQSGLALSLLLLSIVFFLDGKYLFWGLLVGISADLNALYAAITVAYCIAIFVAERRAARDLAAVAAAAVLMVVCALPLLIYLHTLPPQNSFDHRLWWQAMQTRSPHHLMPLTWPPLRYAEYAVTAGLLLMIGWSKRGKSSVKLGRFSVAVAITSALFLAAAFVVAYAVHNPRLLTLQPVRGTDLGYCLTDIAFACGAALWFQRSAANPRKAIAIVPVLLVAVVWSLLPAPAMIIAIGGGIGVYLLITWLSKSATPVARIRFASIACLASLAVGAIARPALTWQYTFFNTGNRWPVSGAAEWAARSTPRDDLFLLDALDDHTEPFRALSKRSVFVHVKDGTVLFYKMDYLDTWRKRMELAGYPLDPASKMPRYPHWHDAEAIALHRTMGVNHWLVPHGWPTSLPIVYQDKSFEILDLNGRVASAK